MWGTKLIYSNYTDAEVNINISVEVIQEEPSVSQSDATQNNQSGNFMLSKKKTKTL